MPLPTDLPNVQTMAPAAAATSSTTSSPTSSVLVRTYPDGTRFYATPMDFLFVSPSGATSVIARDGASPRDVLVLSSGRIIILTLRSRISAPLMLAGGIFFATRTSSIPARIGLVLGGLLAGGALALVSARPVRS